MDDRAFEASVPPSDERFLLVDQPGPLVHDGTAFPGHLPGIGNHQVAPEQPVADVDHPILPVQAVRRDVINEVGDEKAAQPVKGRRDGVRRVHSYQVASAVGAQRPAEDGQRVAEALQVLGQGSGFGVVLAGERHVYAGLTAQHVAAGRAAGLHHRPRMIEDLEPVLADDLGHGVERALVQGGVADAVDDQVRRSELSWPPARPQNDDIVTPAPFPDSSLDFASGLHTSREVQGPFGQLDLGSAGHQNPLLRLGVRRIDGNGDDQLDIHAYLLACDLATPGATGPPGIAVAGPVHASPESRCSIVLRWREIYTGLSCGAVWPWLSVSVSI